MDRKFWTFIFLSKKKVHVWVKKINMILFSIIYQINYYAIFLFDLEANK